MAAPKVQVNVRLSPTLYTKLQRETDRQQRSMTDVVAEAVETYLVIVTPKGKGKQ